MKGLVLSIFVFCAVLATAYSLKCYVCTGTEEQCSKSKLEANKASRSVDCSGGECIRFWGKKDDVTLVINSCGGSSTCAKTKEACDQVKDGKCAVGCCDSDYCNAGSSYSSSVILITVTSALGLALLK
ncbi:hypothetical protein pdam_00024759 [Pocillopora damicornis]|uniref:UPAR/Ly6 domain-containing protein n=1 Tax=Pocillopora damicornis TaxID=46731 RepID=A0A3M6U7H7_POCDA|nr:uncharacterized protein LOC113667881 [Pocillopora damicornis]RMX49499.1 hypothetical protein pdam_00024759 [Pocillopora damicornis]